MTDTDPLTRPLPAETREAREARMQMGDDRSYADVHAGLLQTALRLRRGWLAEWTPTGVRTGTEKAAWDSYCGFLTRHDLRPQDVWAYEATR